MPCPGFGGDRTSAAERQAPQEGLEGRRTNKPNRDVGDHPQIHEDGARAGRMDGRVTVTIQKIIESLLRARLYHLRARLRLRSGDEQVLQVQDVCYRGSRSRVVVSRPERPRETWSIPLDEVVTADCGESEA